MNNLRRNKRSIYICNKIVENDRYVFSNPIKYDLNYQPLSSDGEVIAFGNDYINRLLVYTSPEIAKNFHNFDRAYVFVDIPETADKFCTTADFYIDGEPLIYLNDAKFYLQRMTGDENE